MLVFIDDAGDAGFKFDKGSSRHFVIACIIFDDNKDAEKAANKIREFRETLNWHPEREFKFNKSNKRIRLGFLNEMNQCSFRVRAIIVDKTMIRSPELRHNEHSFYNFMIKEVLFNSNGGIWDASIRLDGHGDHEYKKAAMAYFRKQVNISARIIREMRFVDSKRDNLIQLADMVAGSILRTRQTGKTDSRDYIQAIHSHMENLWNFQ